MTDITTKIIKKQQEVKQIGEIEKKILEGSFMPSQVNPEDLNQLITYYAYWYENTPIQAKQTRVLYATMKYLLEEKLYSLGD
jgi:hypothetical protein